MDNPTDDSRILEFEARIARGEKIEPGDWMPTPIASSSSA